MYCKDASVRSKAASIAKVRRIRTAICGGAVTVAVLAAPLFVTTSPAAADGWSGCTSFFCGGSNAAGASGWQIEIDPNGSSSFAHPGMFASWNHRGSFTLFWYGFFSRFSRAHCLTIEGPVSETGQSSGWGVGAVTVNEGGEGNQPVLCEVVAE